MVVLYVASVFYHPSSYVDYYFVFLLSLFITGLVCNIWNTISSIAIFLVTRSKNYFSKITQTFRDFYLLYSFSLIILIVVLWRSFMNEVFFDIMVIYLYTPIPWFGYLISLGISAFGKPYVNEE